MMKLNPMVLSVAEDIVVVAGTAVTTWQTTGSAGAVVAAVSAAPVVKSLLALLVSKGKTAHLAGVKSSKATEPAVPASA